MDKSQVQMDAHVTSARLSNAMQEKEFKLI